MVNYLVKLGLVTDQKLISFDNFARKHKYQVLS